MVDAYLERDLAYQERQRQTHAGSSDVQSGGGGGWLSYICGSSASSSSTQQSYDLVESLEMTSEMWAELYAGVESAEDGSSSPSSSEKVSDSAVPLDYVKVLVNLSISFLS